MVGVDRTVGQEYECNDPPTREKPVDPDKADPPATTDDATTAKPSPPENLPSDPVKPPVPREHGGPKGRDPTRYQDWERGGRCIDF